MPAGAASESATLTAPAFSAAEASAMERSAESASVTVTVAVAVSAGVVTRGVVEAIETVKFSDGSRIPSSMMSTATATDFCPATIVKGALTAAV